MEVFLLVLIVSAGAAFWIYSDAKERGSDFGCLWAIGVFFLAAVFLPVWFLQRGPKQSHLKFCPYCEEYWEYEKPGSEEHAGSAPGFDYRKYRKDYREDRKSEAFFCPRCDVEL